MMKKITGAVVLFLTILAVNAQETSVQSYSLKQAVDYALQFNNAAKNAKLSEDQAKWRNREIITTGLPQVSANIDYSYYFKVPEVPALAKFFSDTTQSSTRVFNYLASQDSNIRNLLLRSAIESKDQQISFVLPHNLTAGLQVSQLFFDARYVFGIKATKDLLRTSRLTTQLTEQDIRYNVSKAYYQAQAAAEGVQALSGTLTIIEKLVGDTRKVFETGLAEETDVDRLELIEANLKSQITLQTQMAEVALANLKFQMGLGLGDAIILTDNLDELKQAANVFPESKFDVQQRTEYELLNTAIRLKGYDAAQKRSGYYPSLFGFLNYGWTAQTEKFGDIFKTTTQYYPDGDSRKISPWFSQGLVGLTLKLPIFDSGQRMAQVKQAKLDQQKTANDLDNFKKAAELQYRVAVSQFNSALVDVANTQKATDLSEKIFKKNQIKFKEGAGSSFELTQSEQDFVSNRLKHIQSSLTLLNAKADLDKALGVK